MFEEIKTTFKESAFNQCDWSEFYPEAQEAIPLNIPEPKGNSVNITVFVDADHAGNCIVLLLERGLRPCSIHHHTHIVAEYTG